MREALAMSNAAAGRHERHRVGTPAKPESRNQSGPEGLTEDCFGETGRRPRGFTHALAPVSLGYELSAFRCFPAQPKTI
jgi:hypothetical protein